MHNAKISNSKFCCHFLLETTIVFERRCCFALQNENEMHSDNVNDLVLSFMFKNKTRNNA